MAPMINPNFEERPPIPPGLYAVRVKNCEQKMSKRGTPFLNFTLEIEAQGSELNGQWVFLSTGLSGAGAQKLKELIHATIDPNYESGPIDTDHMLGFPLQVRLEEGYMPDGSLSKYPQVAEILPPSDAQENF